MAKKKNIHQFKKIDIPITNSRLKNLAKQYIKLRSHIKNVEDIENDPRFKNLGFSTKTIKSFYEKHTQPIRVSTKPVRDIYRSDLGEMLLTMYFHLRTFGIENITICQVEALM